jgi:hypothetical protein
LITARPAFEIQSIRHTALFAAEGTVQAIHLKQWV